MESDDNVILNSDYEQLPAELHYIILQHLEFDIATMSRLRAVNKWFSDLLTLENIIDDIIVWDRRYQKLTEGQRLEYFRKLIYQKAVIDASKKSFNDVDASLKEYVEKANLPEKDKVITELQKSYVRTPVRVAILTQNKIFIDQYAASSVYQATFIVASKLFTQAVSVSVEFAKWSLAHPLLAPLKGKPDPVAISSAIDWLWQKNPAYSEQIEYSLNEYITCYNNYSAAHRVEKLRQVIHSMLHWNFDMNLLDITLLTGQKVLDMIGIDQITPCSSCFYSSLTSDVDHAELEKKFWPDESSIPKLASAMIYKPVTFNAFAWLKERNLLHKIFDSTLVQSFVILKSLSKSNDKEDAFTVAELMIEEGFEVSVQRNNWGVELERKMLSVSADRRVTRKIFDLFWTEFPSEAARLLISVMSSPGASSKRETIPLVLLEFAESIPKQYRSDILLDGKKITLWHLIATYTLKDNIYVLKVIPKVLEITECDINAVDSEGRTALHMITFPNPHSSIFYDLLNLGAKITLGDNMRTPQGLYHIINPLGKTSITFNWAQFGSTHPHLLNPSIILEKILDPFNVPPVASGDDFVTYQLYPGTYLFTFNYLLNGQQRSVKRVVEVLKQDQQEVEIDEAWLQP